MSELTELSLCEMLEALGQKRVSSVELIRAHVAAVEYARPCNAFITETIEGAYDCALESDRRRWSGEGLALDGIPIAIKDMFCTRGVRTTAGSRILDNFIPPYESTVTGKLLATGTISLGKTNLDEFAMGASNVTSWYGAVVNPWSEGEFGEWERRLVPGGSSGGSAAAVASYCVPVALGTDTGGSIRQPASFCGLVGLKPTYGRCSRWGIIAFASSLDQAGVIARTVRDAALVLRYIAGYDEKDSTSVDIPVQDYVSSLGGGIKGLRVGIPQEYCTPDMPESIGQLWWRGQEWLRDAGAEVVPVSLPHTSYALAVYYIIAPAEASSNLARYDGIRYGVQESDDRLYDVYARTRRQGLGEEVRRRILIGTYVLSEGYYDAYYVKAQKVRKYISQDFRNVFESCGVILTPSTPSAAFAIGEKMEDPTQMYLNDIFTVPASLAGLPAVSVPCGLSQEGLPLGLQLIGRPFDEQTLLRTASVLEKQASFTVKPPLRR